jgi:hypothetical protein
MMALVTVRTTLPALLTRQPTVARWSTVREPAETAAVVPAQRQPDSAAVVTP